MTWLPEIFWPKHQITFTAINYTLGKDNSNSTEEEFRSIFMNENMIKHWILLQYFFFQYLPLLKMVHQMWVLLSTHEQSSCVKHWVCLTHKLHGKRMVKLFPIMACVIVCIVRGRWSFLPWEWKILGSTHAQQRMMLDLFLKRSP